MPSGPYGSVARSIASAEGMSRASASLCSTQNVVWARNPMAKVMTAARSGPGCSRRVAAETNQATATASAIDAAMTSVASIDFASTTTTHRMDTTTIACRTMTRLVPIEMASRDGSDTVSYTHLTL